MCIIAVKEKGVATPSGRILQNMFDNNPDGAGVAYTKNGKLIIKKGLMTFEEFLKECNKIDVEDAAVYHCRITTHGGTCKELTHPFKLCASIKEQRKTAHVLERGAAVVHNGIFSDVDAGVNNSDTTAFITTFLAPLQRIKEREGASITTHNDLDAVIQRLTGTSNRLAIIDQDGNIKRFGGTWAFSGGLWFSNYTYSYSYISYYNNDYYKKADGKSAKDAKGKKTDRERYLAGWTTPDPTPEEIDALAAEDPDFSEMLTEYTKKWKMDAVDVYLYYMGYYG